MLDREKTVLQETGEVTLFPGPLTDVLEIIGDLGLNVDEVHLSSVTLSLAARSPSRTEKGTDD